MPRISNFYKDAQYQRRLWTPWDLPVKPWAWFDFSTLPSVNVAGQGVSQIKSIISGPNLEQGVDGSRPPLVSTGSLLYADFDGANDTIGINYAWPENGPMTFCAVYNPAVVATNQFVHGNGGTGGGFSRKYLWTGGCDFGNTSLVGNNLVAGDWNVAIADVAGTGSTTQRHFGNGGEPTSGTVTNNSLNSVVMLASYNGGSGFTDVSIAMFMIIAAKLADSDIRKLEGYCAYQFGLARVLAASHPFRNRPPLIGD